MSRISLRRLNERADLSVPRGTPQMGARYDADAFGRFAEGMARFLGTGRFIVGQTVLVVGWIILNTVGAIKHWDPYPFILLNLAFSTQAAYAAPLILLAQNRQDDRDRANIERDRDVAARTQADTEFLARELAAVRLSLADVVTTHDLEDSLSQLAKLITVQPRPRRPRPHHAARGAVEAKQPVEQDDGSVRFMRGRDRWPAQGGPARPAGGGTRWPPIGRGQRGSPGVRRWRRAGCAAAVRRAVRPTTRSGRRRRGARCPGCCAGSPAEHRAVRRRGTEPQAKPGPPPRQRATRAGWRVFEHDPGPLLGRTILHRAGSHDEGVLVIDAGEGARQRVRRRRPAARPAPPWCIRSGRIGVRESHSRPPSIHFCMDGG